MKPKELHNYKPDGAGYCYCCGLSFFQHVEWQHGHVINASPNDQQQKEYQEETPA